jgi:peptide/nickel transport system substrate-binding protein
MRSGLRAESATQTVTSPKNSRHTITLPLIAVSLALTASCGSGRVPDDTLVVLIETPPLSIDPRYAVNSYDFKIGRLVYAPLVSTDTLTTDLQMELAESVVPHATPDGGHDWLVTLRDARFSDGKAVTSDDILYTFERLRDPKTGGAAARLRNAFREAGMTDITAPDAKHVTFHLTRPYASLVGDLNVGIMERPQPGAREGEFPIGAGAFSFAGRKGETWTLAANPYYFGGPPKVKRLVFKTIRDDNSRLLALVGGSGDLTQNTISQLLVDAVAEQPRLKVESGRSSVYTYLGVNNEDPILKDVRVRQAIAFGIDRATIVHTTLHDRALLATGMLPTFHWAYSGDVDHYAFDPARAKQLLDAAGYPDPDGDGPLPRFTITLKSSSNKLRVAIGTVVADQLRKIGIGVELRVYEFATFFADIKKGNSQLFIMQIPEISEPNLYNVFFASNRIPTRENLDAGGNRVRYRSAEVDRLLVAGRGELDRDKRKVIYAKIQQILARELPVVSLWHEDNLVAMRKAVDGFTILPTTSMSSLAHTAKSTR